MSQKSGTKRYHLFNICVKRLTKEAQFQNKLFLTPRDVKTLICLSGISSTIIEDHLNRPGKKKWVLSYQRSHRCAFSGSCFSSTFSWSPMNSRSNLSKDLLPCRPSKTLIFTKRLWNLDWRGVSLSWSIQKFLFCLNCFGVNVNTT